MLKIQIHTIGRLKEAWLSEALQEYEKRLKGKMRIEWFLWKDDPELSKHVQLESSWIALDVKGELLSSEELSKKLFEAGARFTFVIGGAMGLPPALVSQAKWRLSLSPLTFTHQMTRLILVEQLYRAHEIQKNGPYHKA
ncbi:MAG: 23S rRNA (pseudouridine(1915)-N(3))-methyltransferase RlmH [Chlamydiales bacterium]|nr:23S rRNA (pseudouridine(1915)-N(3))-methyltransferase RlmH [Chlamydiales bacterium]